MPLRGESTIDAIYRLAFERSPAGCIVVDRDGTIVLVSRRIERLFGYAREELIGAPIEILVPENAVEEHRRRRASYVSEPEERPMGQGRELHGRHKDGTRIPVEIGLNPIHTEEGLFVVGSVVDISARVDAERRLRDSERHLERAQRLESLGTLAGGIAHDFNNILLGVIGYAELLRDSLHDNAQALEDVSAVIEASRRGKELVNRILTFARDDASQAEELRLQQTVTEALRLLRATLPATVHLVTAFDDATPSVRCSATEFHQIMMNLCSNAVAAMTEQGGKLIIRLEPCHVSPDAAREHPPAQPGLHARVTVQDTGRGMSEDVVSRAFDPFFTTKAPGKGTGLGLPVVHGIAAKYGGFVKLESGQGVGTKVCVLLPAATKQSASASQQRQARRLALWVDDEPLLAELGRRQLESSGIAVSVHTSSLEALEEFRNRPEDFSLVVSDNTMPQLTGLELIREVTRIRPDIATLMVTGHGMSVSPSTLVSHGVRRVLPKPFDANELRRVVGELLGDSK